MSDYPKPDPNSVIDKPVGQSSPNTNTKSNYVSLNDVNDYVFMDNTYSGECGYNDGTYLIPHVREYMYDERREFSTYTNFLKPIVRAMVEPVFADGQITRDYSENELFEQFESDCTHGGLSLTKFENKIITLTRLHKITFVVVDNIKDQPETQVDAVKNKAYPYVYSRKASQVVDWESDKFGNLKTITFVDKPEENTMSGKEKNDDMFRKWTDTYSVLVKEETDPESATGRKFVELDETRVVHGLGVIPVIVSRDSDDTDDLADLQPTPNLKGIARICHEIYNKDSEIRELERKQGFCILVGQGFNKDSFTIGAANCINIPPNADINISPQYISPDPQLMAGLVNNREKRRDDLYQLAAQSGVIATQKTKQAKSGEALGYEFHAYNHTLEKTSELAHTLDLAIVELFKLWTGQSFEYSSEFPSDFKPNQDTEDINNLDTINNTPGLPIESQVEIQKKFYLKLKPDATPEELKLVEEQVKSDAENEKLAQDRDNESDDDTTT